MRTMTFCCCAVLMSLGLLAGCQSTEPTHSHEVVTTEGTVITCQACYDQTVAVKESSAKGSQWDKTQIIKEHRCKDCDADVTVYTKDGRAMIKCGKCAPSGVACDVCRPPRSRS